MAEVLLNRNVSLIDEVAESMELSGGPSLASILDGLRQGIALQQQPGLTEGRQRHAAEQNKLPSGARSSVTGLNTSGRRRLKIASPRPAAAAKLGADRVFLELDFSRRAMWPQVSSLALCVSPELSADTFACCAFIARADHSIVVLYVVGPYRPCLHGSGFYLIKTLAAAPQLPKSISLFSHRCRPAAHLTAHRLYIWLPSFYSALAAKVEVSPHPMRPWLLGRTVPAVSLLGGSRQIRLYSPSSHILLLSTPDIPSMLTQFFRWGELKLPLLG